VEALEAWRRQGSRGVVEAVTGTGKTRLGVAAIAAELATGGQGVVLVPTRELLGQWEDALVGSLPRGVRVGLLGDGGQGSLGRDDVLVAVVNSAREGLRPRRPGGVLVADECHRYASECNRLALGSAFPRRLGLTATLARPDDGHTTWLAPYFGETCFRMGYRRAMQDGVMARFALALVGVRFSPEERDRYDELSLEMRLRRAKLLHQGLVREDPVGAFLQDVARLAQGDDDDAALARGYLGAMQERRHLLAETPAKGEALRSLEGAFRGAERALVFTLGIAAAEQAARDLRALGLTAEALHSGLDRAARRSVLARFASGDVRVATAPQVLDEGIDVPAADLAVVLAASRSRRQMTQRMGRVLRRKPDGRLARFGVVFVEGTIEDPATGAHEGFLDEVTAVADRQERFSSRAEVGAVSAFLADRGVG
jgi:superfamily II DNA or RNA helicase